MSKNYRKFFISNQTLACSQKCILCQNFKTAFKVLVGVEHFPFLYKTASRHSRHLLIRSQNFTLNKASPFPMLCECILRTSINTAHPLHTRPTNTHR